MSKYIEIPALTVAGLKNSVTSLKGSARYIQKCLPIAIYNIIHKRVNYRDSYFTKRTFNKIPYMVLSKRIPKNHPLYIVSRWIEDAMAAVADRYANKLYLLMRDKSTEGVIEHYCFSIDYTDDNGVAGFNIIPEEISAKTEKLIKAIDHLSYQDKLNSNYVSYAIRLELNDKAPKDYVAKSFEKSETGCPTSNSTSDHAAFGTINVFNIKKRKGAAENANNGSKKMKCEGEDDCSDEVDISVQKDIENLVADYTEDIAFQDNLITRDDDIVCLCKLPYNIPNIEKIVCTSCEKYQHVACGGYTSAAIVPHPHTCHNCWKEKGIKGNDIRMRTAKSEIHCFKLSIMRLLCVFCSKTEQSPKNFLKLLSADLKTDVLGTLIRNRILIKDNGTYVPNRTKISLHLKGMIFYDSVRLANSNVVTIE